MYKEREQEINKLLFVELFQFFSAWYGNGLVPLSLTNYPVLARLSTARLSTGHRMPA
jgi:hypothetical protein